MRQVIVLVSLGLITASLVGGTSAQPQNAAGFQDLFNGKDLSGWKAHNCQLSDWQVKDGVLRTPGTGGKDGWLVTEAEYSDFVLRGEFRLFQKTNSGIALRAPLEGASLAFSGMEVQLLDDDSYPNTKAVHRTGAIYAAVPRTKAAAKALGEWNQIEITAEGSQVKVVLNGTTVVDANLKEYANDPVKGLHRARGHIGLQTHTGAVEFRNLRLKSLSSTTPAVPQAGPRPELVLDARGHTGTVKKVLFTPDGKSLISVATDKTVRIWDVATGQPTHVMHVVPDRLDGASGKLFAAAISPDGGSLAVGGFDWRVYVISLATRKVERVLSEHRGTVNDIQFSPTGRSIAVGCIDGRAHFYRADTGVRTGYTAALGEAITGVAISPDGQSVVLTAANKTGRLLATTDFSVLAELVGHEGALRGVSWRPDGSAFATCANDGTIRVWNSDGTHINTFENLASKAISSVTFAPDGKSLVYTSDGDTAAARRIDAKTGKELASDPKAVNSMNTAAFSPDGKVIASSGFTSGITLWRADNGELVARLNPAGRSIWSAGWSRDGTTIGWGHRNRGSGGMWLNDYGDLERSWGLTDFQFGTPNAQFVRGRLELNGLVGERAGPTKFAFKRGGDTVGTVDTEAFSSIWYRSATLVPNERVLLGMNNGAVGLVGLQQVKGEPLTRHYYDHADTVWAVAPSPDPRYFLSGSNDQTLKIWAFDRPSTPLLTFFVANNDWVAWTPEGYYAASAGGENLVGWKTSNSGDVLATFHPAAQFHKTYYRPDIIKKLLVAGSVEKALALADRERGQKSVQTDIAQVLPPKVAITFPEKSGQKIAATKFEVKTSASSVGDHPVTSLRLLVDGRPYGGEASLRTVRSAKVGPVTDSWQVDLPPGPHRLAVVAGSAVSQSVSDEIEIFVSPTATSTKAPTANLHLLAVGINAYPGRLKLDCAVPDAKAIDLAFRTHSKGVYQVQSTLLLDKEATRANILKGISALEKQAKPGDVVVLYYAGHGDCKLAGQFVMLSVDASVTKDKLVQTGVTGDEVKARLARLPCTVLLIMDCCYAGSFDAPGKKKRALPTQAGDLVRELVSDDHGLVVMCGASKEQESGEESKLGHGYFTLALTEGLAGKAASKRDGLVYLSGLQLYVEERVRELSQDEQYPTIGKPTLVRSFPLSKP